MRVSRVFIAAATAVTVAIATAAVLSAQTPTEDDYYKLSTAVGAANGADRVARDRAMLGNVMAEEARAISSAISSA